MKQFILPLIALLIVGSAKTQTQYESPHVKDGKTIQFTIPKGYFFVKDSDVNGDAMFTVKENFDFNELEFEDLEVGVLMVIHEQEDEDMTLQTFIDGLSEGLEDINEELVVLEAPKIIQSHGREYVLGGYKGEMEDEKISGIYFSMIRFGDYNMFISYFAPEGVEDVLPFDKFEKIVASWKEVPTTRDDEMTVTIYSDDEVIDHELFDDVFDTDYNNDFFETELSYYDILPDNTEFWNEPMEDNKHLLSEFVFKEDNGTVKVFSGGLSANYPTDKEKAAAIQTVMEMPTQLRLKKESEFSNEDHFFQLYSISGGGTLTSVYTTIVNEELVFFLINGGTNPVPDFKPAVRDFMLTMLIEYLGDDESQPSGIDPDN